MGVAVDKLKDTFLSRMQSLYNSEVYFIETCNNYSDKYPLSQSVNDLSLEIFFQENNKIIISGKCLKYCDKDSKRKIRLINISDEVNSPDINIINNYVIEDKWNQIDW